MEISDGMPYLCTRNQKTKRILKGNEVLWKVRSKKKSSERFGRDAKMSYLCTTFRSERALKTFEVFLKKIWKVRKKGFTFATAFRFEK